MKGNDCLSLGMDRICEQCNNYYTGNYSRICWSNYYFVCIKNGIEIRNFFTKRNQQNYRYLQAVVEKYFPQHIDELNKFMILK
jgi:hypothetical protein